MDYHAQRQDIPVADDGDGDGAGAGDVGNVDVHFHEGGGGSGMDEQEKVVLFPSFPQWFLSKHVALPIQQQMALLKKNALLFLRSWFGTLILLLVPIVLIMVLQLLISVMIQAMQMTNTDDPHPEPMAIGKIQPCIVGPGLDHCRVVSYAPRGAPFDGIIDTLLRDNELSTDKSMQKAFANAGLLQDDLLEHPNVTLFSIIFSEPERQVTGVKNMHYKIMFNGSIVIKAQAPVLGISFEGAKSLDYIHTVQFWMDQAITKYHLQSQLNQNDQFSNIVDPLGVMDYTEALFDIELVQFPTVGVNKTSGQVVNLETQFFYLLGPFFIILCFCPFWMFATYHMVTERERLLRWSMTMMGMKNWTYWASWFITMFAIALISVSGMILAGLVTGIKFFVHTSPFVLLCIFIPYAIVMISYAFMISSFISNVRLALLLSFMLNAVMVIGGIFMANNVSVRLLYVGSDMLWWVDAIVTVLELTVPLFGLGKCLAEIIPIASAGSYFGVEEMGIVHIRGYMREAPTVWGSIAYMLLDCALLFILVWYLDNVVPNKNGSRKKLLYFLQPSYWGMDLLWKKNDFGVFLQEHRDQIEHTERSNDHVTRERLRAYTNAAELHKDESSLLRVLGLSKTYKTLFSKPVHALNDVAFTAERGQVLCILGRNGAGKTTMLNQLVGLLEPTGTGTATIFGRDIRLDMDEIRSFIGCCPQHDILFENLTAYEHMDLFSQIKGLSLLKKKKVIHNLLMEVGLFDVRNKRAGTFSGGMKRRLSFAISIIGDPELVFLDEPSTGLSVEARRHLWELIYQLKKNRAVILTSHSMEECEKLADKVVIMAEGRVHAVGSTIDLKKQYSAGYTLSIVANDAETGVPIIDQVVRQHVPHCEVVTRKAGSMMYGLQTSEMRELIPLVKEIELLAQEQSSAESSRSTTQVVRDWSISGTSLEHVYLHVTSGGIAQY